MLRQMPPLEAVEAFLAAARARSFRAAATSLALSPSAFSRRIQLLERFAGQRLFDRTGPTTVLTCEGSRYLAEVGPAIEAIQHATTSLRAVRGERPLRIASSHSMAAEWLMPRLPKLLADIGLEVALTVSRDPELLRAHHVDLALWGGPTRNQGTIVDVIAELDAVPVAAPRLADGRRPPASLAAFADHRLIEVQASAGLWRHWLRRAGYRGPRPAIAATYETNQLKNEAAASGMGVALAVPLVTERFLADNRLIACAAVRMPTDQSYCMHYAGNDVRSRSDVKAFLGWLQQEARSSLEKYDAWFENRPSLGSA